MITEIAEKFYRITLPMPFRLSHVHIYALVSSREVTLFDTGMIMPGAYEKLEEDLKSIGLSVSSVRNIYLTHVHHDHCGMVGMLREKSKARIHLSADAYRAHAYFQNTDHLLAQTGLFYAKHGMPPKAMEAIMEDIEDVSIRIPHFTAATFLQNNEIRQSGSRSFEVIFTPGHAPGHVCFFFREEGILLAGDHILPYIVPSLFPNINDEIFHPLQSYLESLDVIEKLPIKIIQPGHGSPMIEIEERIRDIRTQHTLKEQIYLKKTNTRPKTAFAVCVEVMGEQAIDRDDWDKFMAFNEACVYLQELKRREVIKENFIDGLLSYSSA